MRISHLMVESSGVTRLVKSIKEKTAFAGFKFLINAHFTIDLLICAKESGFQLSREDRSFPVLTPLVENLHV